LYVHCGQFHDTHILPAKPFNVKFETLKRLYTLITVIGSVQTKQTRITWSLDSYEEELLKFEIKRDTIRLAL